MAAQVTDGAFSLHAFNSSCLVTVLYQAVKIFSWLTINIGCYILDGSPFNSDVPCGTTCLHQVARLQVLQHHLGWLWHLGVPERTSQCHKRAIYSLTSQVGKAVLLHQTPQGTAWAPCCRRRSTARHRCSWVQSIRGQNGVAESIHKKVNIITTPPPAHLQTPRH